MVCHGPMAISSGVLPDLRWSSIAANPDSWKNVVLDGALAKNGMVAFSEYLSVGDAEAIRAYVVARARRD
ncbi:MAG: c-type cytochrome, partial [Pseudomonadales bacterium]